VRVIDGRIVVSELETDTPPTEPAVEYRRVEEGELQCATPLPPPSLPLFLVSFTPVLSLLFQPNSLHGRHGLPLRIRARHAPRWRRSRYQGRHAPPKNIRCYPPWSLTTQRHDRPGQHLRLMNAQYERWNTWSCSHTVSPTRSPTPRVGEWHTRCVAVKESPFGIRGLCLSGVLG
jgi:hypothetical protein